MKNAGILYITKAEIMQIMRVNFEGIKPETYPNEFYSRIAESVINSITTDYIDNAILDAINWEFGQADKALYEAQHGL